MKTTLASLVVGVLLGLGASAAASAAPPANLEKKCSPEGGRCKKTIDCCGRYFCKNEVCKP